MVNYYLLIKPGIILGNLITFAAGFLLASKGGFDAYLFILTLVGLGFIIASACVFNNYIDRSLDKKMERTKNRGVASGKIKGSTALFFGTILAIIGNLILYVETNILALAIANVGFCVYVFVYSFVKSQTVYSTLIGSIAGAVPPVVGYCAVSQKIDLAAFVLFLMLVLWQMPHFYAIALWHLKDYSKANLPLLPMVKGTFQTKVHMALYIAAFIPVMASLTLLGYLGQTFLFVTLCIGLLWLILSIQGFRTVNHTSWGRQMFRVSLVMINAICFLILYDFIK